LKRKWIAEGFIDTQWGDLDQEADKCFNELVNRSMIQPVDADYDSSIQYCQVHDIVLDIIISLSDEENFATVLNGRTCNSLRNKIRRLSVHSSGQENKIANVAAQIMSHARSLNVFGEFEQIPPLVNFRSLRVLDLREGGSNYWLGNKQIQSIGSLSRLRYLRLDSRRITELPEEIGKLQYLETLDLRKCNSITTLPSTMVWLRKLLRLFVHEETLVLPANVFGTMQTLEEVSSISHVDNPMKFAERLGYLTKLKRLYMPCSLALFRAKNGDYLERFLELLGTSLNELGKYNLRCLHIAGSIGEYLFRDSCCTFPHLQDLEILTLIERVPKGIMASLNNIVKLVIKIELLDEEDLQLLMDMPSLSHLQLTLYHQTGVWKMLTIDNNGFKLLKVFYFGSVLSPGTGIAFAPGALPALRRLHLSCWIARDVMPRGCDGSNLGIEHLSGLAHLLVETHCPCSYRHGYCSILDKVEAVEDSVEKAIALHPNRHTLQVHVCRVPGHNIYKDDHDMNMDSRNENKMIRAVDSDEVNISAFCI
jgi:hypothetical protein